MHLDFVSVENRLVLEVGRFCLGPYSSSRRKLLWRGGKRGQGVRVILFSTELKAIGLPRHIFQVASLRFRSCHLIQKNGFSKMLGRCVDFGYRKMLVKPKVKPYFN